MVYWLWLKNIQGLGPVLSKSLLEKYKTPMRIYKCSEGELLLIKGIGKKLAKCMLNHQSLDKEKLELIQLKKKGIKLLTYHDHRYPFQGKAYKRAPILLYYKGTLKAIKKSVAIIGNSQYTTYSEKVIKQVSKHLIRGKVCLVSGLNVGVESLAEDCFIADGGYQIAFVAHGLDKCYPAYHKNRIEKIIENGAVISEHALGIKPIKAFFLKKNALIASWATDILLIEAEETANALGIIKVAKTLNTSIFVLGQELYRKHCIGSNQVLLQGGRIFIDEEQLTPGIKKQMEDEAEKELKNKLKNERKHDEVSLTASKIIKVLTSSSKTLDELAFELELGLSELMEHMIILELDSKISKLPGAKYTVV